MNKHLFLSLFAAALLMTACSSGSDAPETDPSVPEINDATNQKPVLMARTDFKGTRTSLSPERHVLWNAGDKISAFLKNATPEAYTLSKGENTAAGQFAPDVQGKLGQESLKHYAAVYPYSAEYTIAENSEKTGYVFRNIMFPAEQTYVAGSFGEGAAPMIAVSETTDIKFKNLGGVLKLSFDKAYDYTIGSIEVTGRNNEVIAGKTEVNIGFDGLTPAATLAADGATMIKLNCSPAVKLKVGTYTDFYIVMPAIEYPTGIQLVVKDEGGNVINTLKTKPFSMKRSDVLDMPGLTLEGEGITGEITPGDVLPA